MKSRSCLVLTFLLCLSLGGRPATAAEPEPIEVGALAPADCWPCEGACPARTGQTATRALRGPLQRAWSVAFGGGGGRVEGAPVVWGNDVILSVKLGTEKRVLHVLNLHDGTRAARPRTIKSSAPLRPCVWKETIVICANARKLEAYRTSGGRLRRVSSFDVKARVRDFLLFEGRVYAVTDGSVLCWKVGSARPEWSDEGVYRGTMALRGEDLYVTRYDGEGNAHLVRLDRRTGRETAELFVGHHGGSTPSGSEPLHVVAHAKYVFVHHARPVRGEGDQGIRCTWAKRRSRSSAGSELAGYRTLDALRPVALVDDLVIVLNESAKAGTELLLLEEGKRGEWRQTVLGDAKEHARLLDPSQTISVAGRVAHVGGVSFDLDDYRIHWEHDGPIAFGPIPARDTLLLVDRGNRLLALRAAGGRQEAPRWFGAAQKAEGGAPTTWTGTILFHDGESFTGAFARSGDAATVLFESKPKKEIRRPTADVLVIVDDANRLLYTARLDTVPRALKGLVRARGAKTMLALANDSTRTYDTALMEELADEAESRGVPRKRLSRVRKRIAALREKPRPANADKVRAMAKRLADQRQAEAAAVAQAMASGLEDERPDVQRWFLDALLEARPDDPKATELVRAAVPPILDLPEDFDPQGWLRLADALRHKEMKKLVPPTPRQRDITPQQRELGAARGYWRKDLVGLLGEETLLITPLDKPAVVADVLMMSHLVNAALEDLCSGLPSVREKRLPLTVQLFAEQGAFRELSRSGGPGTGRKQMNSWEVAYYSGADHLTRMLAPPEPRLRMWALRTFATSLARHWMSQRCPLYRESEMDWDSDQAGYWANVGMAEWMREIDWNPEKGTYRLVGRKARSIDIVANAPADKIIPWPIFFATSRNRWLRLPYKPRFRVPMRWVVGYSTIANPSAMFKAQSAVACYFLHSKGGSWRTGLLEIIRDVHTKKIGRDSSYVERRFHLDPDALGARIVEWARGVQSGKHSPTAPAK